MKEYSSLKTIKRGDMTVRIGKITNPQITCNVNHCSQQPIYDIQFEKPKNFSNVGGVFCKEHIKNIFGIEVKE